MKFVYTDGHLDGWFHDKYWYAGANQRYFTFKTALNLLNQRHPNPVIVETGCQRQLDDVGAGMSTSMFAEYLNIYGGDLMVCDNDQRHLDIAKSCVEHTATNFKNDRRAITYACQDSVEFLWNLKVSPDLLYLDSYDYPIFEMTKKYSDNFEEGLSVLQLKSHEEVQEEFKELVFPCQNHCLNEFKAVEDTLLDNTILLIDDNCLPGGGKPGLLKPYLVNQGWTCLLDFQQTLWVKEL